MNTKQIEEVMEDLNEVLEYYEGDQHDYDKIAKLYQKLYMMRWEQEIKSLTA